jgi:hypothetical protein
MDLLFKLHSESWVHFIELTLARNKI